MRDKVPAMSKSLYIHAGAHRTGTSSLQLCLAENRAVLDRHGLDVAYPGRDGVQGGRLKLRLPRPRHGAKRIPVFADSVREHLTSLSPDQDRGLVLSEENILGPMRHFYEGRFYPASANRLATMAQALDAPPRHVVFVVRPYDAFYISAFRKRAEDNAVPPFASLRNNLMAMDRGWVEVVTELRDILRPRRLTVVAYGTRGSSAGLLARLVPDLAGETLKEPDQVVNLSATDAALMALQKRYQSGETLQRAVWKSVVEQFRNDTVATDFASFSDADSTVLKARYSEDLERICALNGVETD